MTPTHIEIRYTLVAYEGPSGIYLRAKNALKAVIAIVMTLISKCAAWSKPIIDLLMKHVKQHLFIPLKSSLHLDSPLVFQLC